MTRREFLPFLGEVAAATGFGLSAPRDRAVRGSPIADEMSALSGA